jgi:TRAP-type C4-dicarboxylate transport system permease small subunit
MRAHLGWLVGLLLVVAFLVVCASAVSRYRVEAMRDDDTPEDLQ